jgi:hypothetical protein
MSLLTAGEQLRMNNCAWQPTAVALFGSEGAAAFTYQAARNALAARRQAARLAVPWLTFLRL